MGEPDVFDGAMRIARVEYPDLDPAPYRLKLEAFARQAAGKVAGKGAGGIAELNAFVFDELGFHGNAEDYYDPRNSYLNDVIDRRSGIPITLSTVYCEIARRAGIPAHGVGFPGHFLVACPVGRGSILVDCFNGRTLTRDGCQELLDSMQPGSMRVSEEMFAAASARDILSRMLVNLRRIHAERRDFARAIRWVEMDMELRPGDPGPYRERGLLRAQAEDFGRAIDDLERYARLSPGAPDLPQVREQTKLLEQLLSRLN